MNATGLVEQHSAVERAITDSHGGSREFMERTAPARWQYVLSGDLVATAEAYDGWLRFDAPLAEPPICVSKDPWDLLSGNAKLVGGAKYALVGHCLHARGELPLGVESDLSSRIRALCDGLLSAAQLSPQSNSTPCDDRSLLPTRGADAGNGEDKDVPADLEGGLSQLCEEAGWAFNQRAGGQLAVELEVPGDYRQAMIEKQPSGDVSVSVVLGECEPPPGCWRDAVGLLLLRATGVLHMVRGAAGSPPRFEVVFHGLPIAAELAHALAALSVACRLCAREVEVLLKDQDIASAYIRASPWSPARGP